MTSANPDEPQNASTVLASWQLIHEGLLSGGPEVDYYLLESYLDGSMTDVDQRVVIEQAVARWEKWFNAMSAMRSAVQDILEQND